MSKRDTSTEAGDSNRKTSETLGREHNSGTSAEFGQKIGRSENLSEGGEMENRNRSQSNDLNRDKNVGNESESTRRPSGDSYGSSSGRQGWSDTSSDVSSEKGSNRGSMGSERIDRSERSSDEH